MQTLRQRISEVPASRSVRPLVMVLPWVACVLGALLVHFGLPILGVDDYWQSVLRRAGALVIAAVSLNIVNGYAGQFSMGHAGFMALGGYVAAGVTYYGSLYFNGSINAETFAVQGTGLMLVGILLGALVAAGAGYLVGLPSLRLRGDYLAIVTLGFGEIIRVLLELTPSQIDTAQGVREAGLKAIVHLNGPTGFYGVPGYATLFWVWLLVLVTCVVAYRVKHSSSGRAFLSIREDEIAARSMGIDLTKYKVRAFVLAAFLGGVAGAVYSHTGANPSPQDAGFQRSFDIIIFVVLGGLGSLSGAALSALLLSVLGEVLRGPGPVLDAWVYCLGVAAALAVAAGVLRSLRNRGWVALSAMAAIPVLLLGFALLSKWAKDGVGLDLGEYRLVLYAIMLILVMLLRPNGLLGVREIWDLFGPMTDPDKRRRTLGGPSKAGGQ